MINDIMKKPAINALAAALLTILIYSLSEFETSLTIIPSLLIFFPLTTLAYTEEWKWALLGYGIFFVGIFILKGKEALSSWAEVCLISAIMAYMLKNNWEQFHVFLITGLSFAAITISISFLYTAEEKQAIADAAAKVISSGQEALVAKLEKSNAGADIVSSAIELYQRYIRILQMSVPAILVIGGLLLAGVNVAISKNLAYITENKASPFSLSDFKFKRSISLALLGACILSYLACILTANMLPLFINLALVLFFLYTLYGISRFNERLKKLRLHSILRFLLIAFLMSFLFPIFVFSVAGLVRSIFPKEDGGNGVNYEA